MTEEPRDEDEDDDDVMGISGLRMRGAMLEVRKRGGTVDAFGLICRLQFLQRDA